MVQAAKEDLLRAGCPECSAQAIKHLLDEERFYDALHKMRVIRCDLMEELHQSQLWQLYDAVAAFPIMKYCRKRKRRRSSQKTVP